MVVVTSVRAARRRLRYESWHLLHLYAYLGVGLALPHQIWTGTDFVSSPAARAYWWTLYAAALGAVLVYRVGLPLVRTLRHQVVVSRVVEEAPGVVSLHLRGRQLHRLPSQGRAVLRLAVPRRAGLVPRAPLLPVGRAAPHHAAHHREGPRRRQPAAGRPAARHPGAARGAVRRADQPTSAPGPGPPCSRPGSASPRCGRCSRSCPPGATLVYRAGNESDLVLRAEIDGLAAARGDRVAYLLGPRAADGSWLPASWAHVGEAAALLHLVPDIRSPGRVRLRAGGLDRRRPGRAGGRRRAGRPGPRRTLHLLTAPR